MEKELQLRENFIGNPLKNIAIASPYNLKKHVIFSWKEILLLK